MFIEYEKQLCVSRSERDAFQRFGSYFGSKPLSGDIRGHWVM
jgi:hypothetical protein